MPIPDVTLEKLGANDTGKNNEGFLLFVRRMLRWLPERPECEELMFDPWLMGRAAQDAETELTDGPRK